MSARLDGCGPVDHDGRGRGCEMPVAGRVLGPRLDGFPRSRRPDLTPPLVEGWSRRLDRAAPSFHA